MATPAAKVKATGSPVAVKLPKDQHKDRDMLQGAVCIEYSWGRSWAWWVMARTRTGLKIRLGDDTIPYVEPSAKGIIWLARHDLPWIVCSARRYERWNRQRPIISPDNVRSIAEDVETYMARITGASPDNGVPLPEGTPTLANLLAVELVERDKFKQPGVKEQVLQLKWEVPVGSDNWAFDSLGLSLRDSQSHGASRLKRVVNALRGASSVNDKVWFDDETFEFGAEGSERVDGRIQPGVKIILTGEYRPRSSGEGLTYKVTGYAHPSDALDTSKPAPVTQAAAAAPQAVQATPVAAAPAPRGAPRDRSVPEDESDF